MRCDELDLIGSERPWRRGRSHGHRKTLLLEHGAQAGKALRDTIGVSAAGRGRLERHVLAGSDILRSKKRADRRRFGFAQLRLARREVDRMHDRPILHLQLWGRVHLLPLGVVDKTGIGVGAAGQKGDSGNAQGAANDGQGTVHRLCLPRLYSTRNPPAPASPVVGAIVVGWLADDDDTALSCGIRPVLPMVASVGIAIAVRSSTGLTM